MAKMIRKQLYIEQRQDELLRRQARARRTSQADLIREAIDLQVAGGSAPLRPDPAAWQDARDFIETLVTQHRTKGVGRKWSREELYEARLRRYDPRLS